MLFARAGGACRAAAAGTLALQPGERLRWSTLPAEATCRIVLAAPAAPARRAERAGRRLRRLTTRSGPSALTPFPAPVLQRRTRALRWGRRAALPTVASSITARGAPTGTRVTHGAREMLKWAVIFAIIALIAGALGFTGVAAGAAGIAKILFVVFLVLFVGVLLFALLGAKAVAGK